MAGSIVQLVQKATTATARSSGATRSDRAAESGVPFENELKRVQKKDAPKKADDTASAAAAKKPAPAKPTRGKKQDRPEEAPDQAEVTGETPEKPAEPVASPEAQDQPQPVANADETAQAQTDTDAPATAEVSSAVEAQVAAMSSAQAQTAAAAETESKVDQPEETENAPVNVKLPVANVQHTDKPQQHSAGQAQATADASANAAATADDAQGAIDVSQLPKTQSLQQHEQSAQSPTPEPQELAIKPHAARAEAKADPEQVAQAASVLPDASIPSTDTADKPAHVSSADSLMKVDGTQQPAQPSPTQQANQPHASQQAAQPASPESRFAEVNHPKIVTSMRTQLLPDGGKMQIRLDPPEMGALVVSVQMRDGALTASFQTSNDDATKLLSHSLAQLKTVLESQGVSVDKLHVQQTPRDQQSSNDEQNGRQGTDQQNSAWQEQQRKQMLQRMWKRVALGSDPLDLVA